MPVMNPLMQEVAQRFRLYLQNRNLRETAKKYEDSMRANLMAIMENPPEGLDVVTDDKQSAYVYFEEPVSVGERTVYGMKRERRVSQTLNPERVEEFLAANPQVSPDLFYTTEEIPARTETYLDEDKVLAAGFQGVVDDEQIKSFYDVNETWAFVLVDR